MKPKMQGESPTLSNLWFLRFDQNIIYCNILVLRWFWKLNFVCVWISNMSAISGKTGNLNVSLKLFIFFRHHWFAKVLKTPEKFYLSHLSQRLDLQIARLLNIFLQVVKKLSLYKKWSFQLRISSVNVIKSASNCGFGHKIMKSKSNDFRHLCDNMRSKEISLLCSVKFVAVALFPCWTKKNKTPMCIQYLATMKVKFQEKNRETRVGLDECSLVQMDINSFM